MHWCLILTVLFQAFPDAVQDVEQEDLAKYPELRGGGGPDDPDGAGPHQGRYLRQDEDLHSVAGDAFPPG
jgi:hypothetical protein